MVNFCSIAGLRYFCFALSRFEIEVESFHFYCYDIAKYFADTSRLKRSMQHHMKQVYLLQSHAGYRISSLVSLRILMLYVCIVSLKQRLLILHLRDQRRTRVRTSLHWFLQTPHPNASANWNDCNFVLSNFLCKCPTKSIHPKTNSFVANFDTTFGQSIFNLAITQRLAHIIHHR